jgi:hypothetical protein
VIKVSRDLRNRLLFWIILLALAAFHVPLIIFAAHRLSRMPSLALLSFCYLDGFVVIIFIERAMGIKSTLETETSQNTGLDAGWLSSGKPPKADIADGDIV